MGPALANIDGLLEMPYGCGEQNMIKFAPAMFIYRYLDATTGGNIEAKTKNKAIAVMNSGGQTFFVVINILFVFYSLTKTVWILQLVIFLCVVLVVQVQVQGESKNSAY